MNVYILWIIYFDRIDVSEGTDVNKTSALKKWDICHYWYFLNYSFLRFKQISAMDVMIH